MAKVRIELTPRQAEFLRLAMQDFIDVTTDPWTRRNAKAILAKLQSPEPFDIQEGK